MVYDEATSSLDALTEANIMKSLKEAVTKKYIFLVDIRIFYRTSLFIAHRLATIVDADIIYVLEDGHVAEKGPHFDLINQGGLYAKLWESQNHYHGQVPVTFLCTKITYK